MLLGKSVGFPQAPKPELCPHFLSAGHPGPEVPSVLVEATVKLDELVKKIGKAVRTRSPTGRLEGGEAGKRPVCLLPCLGWHSDSQAPLLKAGQLRALLTSSGRRVWRWCLVFSPHSLPSFLLSVLLMPCGCWCLDVATSGFLIAELVKNPPAMERP